MLIFINRRDALVGAALLQSVVSSSLCSSSVLLQDVAKFICTSTPASFRSAVQSSNHFLYRGASIVPVSMATSICNDKPDLLVPGTYGEAGPSANEPAAADAALRYFECLEEQLLSSAPSDGGGGRVAVQARPSTGHIGTPLVRNAQQWGDQVVSVWPLGNELSFVYPKQGETFFPDNSICPTTTTSQSELIVDSNLETALREGREVLFASWYANDSDMESSSSPPTKVGGTQQRRLSSSFLTVPQAYDKKLKVLLQSVNYGLA